MYYSGHYIYYCCEHHILPDDFSMFDIRRMLVKGSRVGRPSLLLESFIGHLCAQGRGRAEALGTFVWRSPGRIHSRGQPSVDCGFCSGSNTCGGVWGTCVAQGEGCGWSVCVCILCKARHPRHR